MSLRVTKVSVEALGTGAGKVRLSRQMLEVLVANVVGGSTIEVTASSALSLSGNVSLISTRNLGITDTLSLTGRTNTEYPVSVASTLSLADSTHNGETHVVVASSLSLAQLAMVQNVLVQAISQSLGLVQAASNNVKLTAALQALGLSQLAYAGQNRTVSVEQALGFVQAARQNFQLASVASPLDLEQAIVLQKNNDIFVNLESEISLTGSATLGNFNFVRKIPDGIYQPGGVINPAFATNPDEVLNLTGTVSYVGTRRVSVSNQLAFVGAAAANFVKNLSVSELLSVQQQLRRIKTASASSSLVLTQAAERVFREGSQLNLSQFAVIFNTKITKSGMTLGQVLQANVNRQLSITDSLMLAQYILPDVDFAIFREDPASTPPPAGSIDITRPHKKTKLWTVFKTLRSSYPGADLTQPTFTHGLSTFYYPTVSPTLTVTLRNPGFGNQQRLQFMRIQRQLRGGEQITYSDPNWPKAETWFMEFSGMTDAQALAFRDFLKQTVGRTVGFFDWEGNTHFGIVMNPNAEFTHVSKCVHSVQIEFRSNLP